MRIYTNHDIWKMSCHRIKFGTLEYKDNLWDLDDNTDRLKLIELLIVTSLIKIIDDTETLNYKNEPENVHYLFLNDKLKIFNTKQNGLINKMQYLTILRNLKKSID